MSRKIFLFSALLIFGLASPSLTAPAWSQGKAKPPPKSASVNKQASTLPTVTVDHWRKSGQMEKHAFLLGFLSMMELEKGWQADQPLTMKDSLISSWGRGLNGLTVPQISQKLDDHIAAAVPPVAPDKSIVEIMWFKFVQPTITEKISPEIKSKGRQMRDKAGQ